MIRANPTHKHPKLFIVQRDGQQPIKFETYKRGKDVVEISALWFLGDKNKPLTQMDLEIRSCFAAEESQKAIDRMMKK